MNNRIEALLEQARTKDYWSEGRYLVDFINQEKFAKLIIRECAKIATDHHENDEGGHPGEKIENYFGIEE